MILIFTFIVGLSALIYSCGKDDGTVGNTGATSTFTLTGAGS